ncbi:MAG: gas vesicle protein K [Pseudomonadota bacterium]
MQDNLTLDLTAVAEALGAKGEGRIDLDPEHVERDLARLVLGLIEFLRQILELRAIQQLEEGRLTPDQEEKLGTTLMRAEAALHDLAAKFGLRPEDLSLDLGPLGRTV